MRRRSCVQNAEGLQIGAAVDWHLARCRRPVQFCVMTSSATAADTEAFFARHSFFGLTKEQTHFFQQVRVVHPG